MIEWKARVNGERFQLQDVCLEKGQPFGNASRKHLAGLVTGKRIRIKYEKYVRMDGLWTTFWLTIWTIFVLTFGKWKCLSERIRCHRRSDSERNR